MTVEKEQLINQAVEPESRLLTTLNFVLTRAANISARAGLAWALLDQDGKLLGDGAALAGLEDGRLRCDVNKHSRDLYHLVISQKPYPGVFHFEGLTGAINNSVCQRITVAADHHSTLAVNPWDTWIKRWNGKFEVAKSSFPAAQLIAGPSRVASSRRPWVTSVSAADMQGGSISLNLFRREFGFLHQLSDLIAQSRAVFYTPAQSEVINSLPTINVGDEFQEYFKVDSVESIRSLLNYCAQQFRCSVTILCDMMVLAELMHADLTDEIMHHIAIADANTEIDMHKPFSLPTNGWELMSSSVVGNCNRLVLQKSDERFKRNSGNRLN